MMRKQGGNFKKNFQKPIDKQRKKCYNIGTVKRENKNSLTE